METNIIEHVGEVVEVINGVNLALCIAVIGARRAGRLQIPFSVALAIQ